MPGLAHLPRQRVQLTTLFGSSPLSRKLSPWAVMRTPIRTEVLQHILHVVRTARPLVEKIQCHDREHGRQIRNALNSVALNTAEAFGSTGGTNRARLESALGSANESTLGLQVAAAWGYVTEAETSTAVSELERLAARLYGLAR